MAFSSSAGATFKNNSANVNHTKNNIQNPLQNDQLSLKYKCNAQPSKLAEYTAAQAECTISFKCQTSHATKVDVH